MDKSYLSTSRDTFYPLWSTQLMSAGISLLGKKSDWCDRTLITKCPQIPLKLRSQDRLGSKHSKQRKQNSWWWSFDWWFFFQLPANMSWNYSKLFHVKPGDGAEGLLWTTETNFTPASWSITLHRLSLNTFNTRTGQTNSQHSWAVLCNLKNL